MRCLSAYVIRKRIDHAMLLLEQGRLSISQVGQAETGFARNTANPTPLKTLRTACRRFHLVRRMRAVSLLASSVGSSGFSA